MTAAIAPMIRDSFTLTIEPGHEEMFLALRDLRTLKTGFTAADLARVCGAEARAADYYLARLVRAGVAHVVGTTTDRQTLYAVAHVPASVQVLNTRGQPDRWFSLRQAVWKAVRIRKTFTIKAVWEDVREAIGNATLKEVGGIIRFLARADYLSELYGETRSGEEEFLLRPKMNTGPLPPRLCEVALAYDLNTRTFHGTALAREVFHAA